MSTNVQPVGPTGPREVAEDSRFADMAGLSVASQVMAIRGACRQLRVEGQSGELRSAANERQQHIEERLEAMRRAEEAQGDAGFWGKVADVMGTVALVAAVVVGVAGSVFTAGASATHESRCFSAAARARAISSRAVSWFRAAQAAASLNARNAWTRRPVASWQSARLSSVPSAGSSAWLRSNSGHARAGSPAFNAARARVNSASASFAFGADSSNRASRAVMAARG